MIHFELANKNLIRIVCKDDETFITIREQFAVENIAAKFNYNSSFSISPKFYCISLTGTFKSGLFSEVYKKSIDYVGKDNVTISPDIKSVVVPRYMYKNSCPDINDIASLSKDFTLMESQKDAVHSAISIGRALVISPTGTGKGAIIFAVLHQMSKLIDNFKYSLLIVPSPQLLNQLKKEALLYGFSKEDIGFYYGKTRNMEELSHKHKIIITTRGFINEKANYKHLIQFQPSVVAVDEVQMLKRNSPTASKIRNFITPYKFGFTATIPKTKQDEWEMVGLIGQIVYEKAIVDAQNEGILSKLKILKVIFKFSNTDLHNINYYSNMQQIREKLKTGKISKDDILPQIHIEEFKMMYLNLWVQSKILEIIDYLGEKNLLLLYDTTEIGEALYNSILKDIRFKDKTVYLVNGNVPVKEREKIQNKVETINNNIIVAQTTTFSTGINIKNIHNIMFAFSSKSFVKIIQSIGRGLRKLENKTHTTLIDMASNMKYSDKHGKERELMYKENYGKSDFDIKKIFLQYNTNSSIMDYKN